MTMSPKELRGALEAILFVSGEPVALDDLIKAFPDEGKEAIEQQIAELEQNVSDTFGGFQLERTAGGFRFATSPAFDPFVRKFFSKQGEGRLSMAALETLSIIAYRQPITLPEISDIRGVNSTAVIRTLLERRMIRVSGRKNVVGSPFLYRTTKEFLVHFGLNDIRDLPRLEEFGDLIGETINDDVVAAIATASSDEAIESEAQLEAQLEEDGEIGETEQASDADDHAVESLRTDQQE